LLDEAGQGHGFAAARTPHNQDASDKWLIGIGLEIGSQIQAEMRVSAENGIGWIDRRCGLLCLFPVGQELGHGFLIYRLPIGPAFAGALPVEQAVRQGELVFF
jgi:hypothetical protein